MHSARVIVDTNVLISYLLVKHSPAGQAASRVFAETQPLASEATLTELADVLARGKFDAYVDQESRQDFFRLFTRIAEIVPVTAAARACRDPRDDTFLELALSGEAMLIITGRSGSASDVTLWHGQHHHASAMPCTSRIRPDGRD